MRFDERIAQMPALYQRTLDFAAALAPLQTLRVNPAVPQTNMLHLYFQGTAEAVADARDAIAERTGTWLFDAVRAADVPGWSLTEIYVGDRLLQADIAAVIALFAQLDESLRGG
jgi:hypothetical protein